MRSAIKASILGLSPEFPVLVRPICGRNVVLYSLDYHDEYEIHLIYRGQGAYFIRDSQYPFVKNDLLVVHPGDIHTLLLPPDSYIDKNSLAFHPRLLGSRTNVAELFAELPFNMSLDEEEATYLDLLLRKMGRELQGGGEHWRNIIMAALETVACIAHRAASKQRPARLQHPRIRCVIHYVNENFREHLPLRLLAEVAGLSPAYLSSLFSRSTGMRLSQYILQRRIAEARRLLTDDPACRVSDIGLAVGFREFADFNRNFKRITGLTPTSYRKISHLSET